MEPPGRRRAARLVAAVLVAAVLSGCSYTDREPGLFGRPGPTPTAPADQTGSRTDTDTDHSLPVVGDEVWTSADGLDVTVRIAIHAVRRVAGATVLDWSVTPLSAPGLSRGDEIPESVDLGLSRVGDLTPSIMLLDQRHRRVYRPLARRTGEGTCLCTFLQAVSRHLRIGRTDLLQLTFPALPADVPTIDVDVATVPIFWRVPVTPDGMLPLATGPTDLNRPYDEIPPELASRGFDYPGTDGQRLVVAVDRVVGASTFTSVEWRVRSITDGEGLGAASTPPIADPEQGGTANPVAASGLRLRSPGYRPDLRTRLVTTTQLGRTVTECLCSDLRRWPSGLNRAERVATLVTTFSPLRRGQSKVIVSFPGVGRRTAEVEPATDASTRSAGPVRSRVSTWATRNGLLNARADSEWPTPVPASEMLAGYRGQVDRLVR